MFLFLFFLQHLENLVLFFLFFMFSSKNIVIKREKREREKVGGRVVVVVRHGVQQQEWRVGEGGEGGEREKLSNKQPNKTAAAAWANRPTTP